MSLPFTRNLIEALTTTQCGQTRVQFVPGTDLGVLIHDSDGFCDVGVTKKTYLAIFSEGHSYFSKGYSIEPENLDESQLWDAYYASSALLITTNEHMTAWRVHEDIVWALKARTEHQFVRKEMSFITALATSRFERINKSLALWRWFRTLVVASSPISPAYFFNLLEKVLQSMEVHYCNYAAGFTAVWLIQNFSNQDTCTKTLDLIKNRCMKNVSDVSMWTLMGTVLLEQTNISIHRDYNYIQEHVNNRQGFQFIGNPSFVPSRFVPSGADQTLANQTLAELLEWLLAIESPVLNAYLQLLRDKQNLQFRDLLKMKLLETKNPLFRETLLTLADRLGTSVQETRTCETKT